MSEWEDGWAARDQVATRDNEYLFSRVHAAEARVAELETALVNQEHGWQRILDGQDGSRELACAYRDAARACLARPTGA